MAYKPKPIDTARVKLPKGLRSLTERLAENNHDLWARQRLAEGWFYGHERNDKKKTHPDLILYHELPESEKEYDRLTVTEVLKIILSLGYTIGPQDEATQADLDFFPNIFQSLLKRLKETPPINLSELMDIWATLSGIQWPGNPQLYELLGERFLKKGEPFLAYDVISKGMESSPENVRLQQLFGLAMARTGATEKANQILSSLFRSGKIDGETLGILARTHKDLALTAPTEAKKRAHLSKAYNYYYEGYQTAISKKGSGWLDDALYNGINAATIKLLFGQKKYAKKLAGEVREFCLKKLKKKKYDYWALASIGEAALIMDHWNEAEDHYARANEIEPDNYGNLSTTRRQAQILLKHLGQDIHRFDHCFKIPNMIVFAGHRIDTPDRKNHRFPPFIVKRVRREITVRLEKLNAGLSCSSAACGADILFLEEMEKRNGDCWIILPLSKGEFQKHYVDITPVANWKRRFASVYNNANRVIEAGDHRLTENQGGTNYTNLMKHGLAILRARALDIDITPLAVWDGELGDDPGGTSSFVEYWRAIGIEPEIIDTKSLLLESGNHIKPRATKKRLALKGALSTRQATETGQEIRAMLFADVSGYGGLRDEQVPLFVRHFMGKVANLIKKKNLRPLTRNTWGDALYFVFETVKKAGHFALELRDMIRNIDWKAKGLPENMSIRISLHAGPVYYCEDPVIGKHKYTGTHVSRAARIEPITPPGEVYASQEFAAIAVAKGVEDFTFEYVGQVPLPKNSGIIPLYLVRHHT